MRRSFVLAVLASALAASAAPAAAQGLFDDGEARRRIEILRGQLNDHTRSMEERLAKIESAVSGATDRSAILELASQIESMRGEIARMRGQVEVLANQAEMAERRQKDLYLDIDTRLRKLEQAQEQAAAAAAQTPATPPTTAAPEPTDGETKAYQAALDQFKLGNYSLAVAAMQNFLSAFPNSSLAPNAQAASGHRRSGPSDGWSTMPRMRIARHRFCAMPFGFAPSYLPISARHQGHSVSTKGFPDERSSRNSDTALRAGSIAFGDPPLPIQRPSEKRLPGIGAMP